MMRIPRTAWIALVLIAILALGVIFRTHMLKNYGFYEPDVFFYYGVMRQSIANGWRIPSPLPYSGFPIHNHFSERPGLIYIPLLLYAIASFFLGHLSFYTFLRLLPVLFGLLEIIATYILAYEVSGDVKIALLAALFIAIMPAGILRTQATEYRGDTIVPTIFAFLLAMAIRYSGVKRISSKRSAAIAIGGAALFSVCLLSWLGAVYIIPVLALWAIAILLYVRTRNMALTLSLAVLIGIVCWAIGWAILPYAAPSYASYLAVHRYLFRSIIETQPANLLTLPVWFNVFIILTPIGALSYLVAKKRKASQNYAYLALVSNLVVGALLVSLQLRWVALAAVPAAVLSAYGMIYIYNKLSTMPLFRPAAKVIFYSLIACTLIACTLTIFTQPSASDVTPQFLTAVAWIKNNTAANATFMTEWQEGSLLEGLGNRTVYVDSVDAGQNATKIYNLTRFLFARQLNFTFLNSTAPNYLLVRSSWLNYSFSLAQEGNLTISDINTTNIYFLLHTKAPQITGDGATLYQVYKSNDTTIYKVIPNHQTT